MDLIRDARRWALSRPHVLLVAVPAEQQRRWAVEAELDRRGWAQALAPADADLLLVVGHLGPQLSEAVEVLWSQVPWPRHRISWNGGLALPDVLDRATQELFELAERGPHDDSQRPDPRAFLSAETGSEDNGDGSDGPHGGTDHGEHARMDHGAHGGHGSTNDGGHGDHDDHGGMDHSSMDHGAMEHPGHGDHGGRGGMDHGGHGGMDHGGHGGMDVAGLSMAETAPDRDGLELDQLQVALGPVLPGWPIGLVLQGALQGDVLTGIELRWLDEEEPHSHPDGEKEQSARVALDALAGFLLVAGWQRAARAARQVRDGMGSVDPAEVEAARRNAARLARRVARSRTLAWNLRGLGRLPGASGRELELLDRIRHWGAVAVGESTAGLPTPSLKDLAEGLEGAELGAVRLVVAGVGLSSVRRRPLEVAGV